jgi:hypothetical protein
MGILFPKKRRGTCDSHEQCSCKSGFFGRYCEKTITNDYLWAWYGFENNLNNYKLSNPNLIIESGSVSYTQGR